MENVIIPQQKTDQPSLDNAHQGLYQPSGELEERGRYPEQVAESSLYSKASLHPLSTAAVVLGTAAAAAALAAPFLRNAPRSKRLRRR